jgi:hypothetical protein
LNVGILCQADPINLLLGKFNQFFIGHAPNLVALVAKIFHAQTRLSRIGNHVRTPVLKVLNASDFDFGRMNVNPIVRKKVGLVDDETHG